MHKAVFAILICTVGAFLTAVYRHYADSYKPALRADESWLHTEPRFYREEFGESAGACRDSVYQPAFPGAEVLVLTKTDRLFTDSSPRALAQAFGQWLSEGFSPSDPVTCPSVRTDEADWACWTWKMEFEEGAVVHRAYLAKRGHSQILVLFSAVPPLVRQFGDTARWLRDLEWYGPGIAYAF